MNAASSRTAASLKTLVALAALTGCRPAGESVATPSSVPSPASGVSVPELPQEFAGLVNPLPNDAATITRGRAAFLTNCAPCHGPEADGRGVAAPGLTPPPANFRDGKRLSSKNDDFLYWRVATGITNTAMPSFAGTISEEDRWAILRFLRSLPGAERT